MSYWTPPLLSQKCFFFHIWHPGEECHFLIGRLCQRCSFQSHCLSRRLHLIAHEIISVLDSNDPLLPLSDKSLLHSLFECFLASYCITLLLWSLLLPYWAIYIFPKCHVAPNSAFACAVRLTWNARSHCLPNSHWDFHIGTNITTFWKGFCLTTLSSFSSSLSPLKMRVNTS